MFSQVLSCKKNLDCEMRFQFPGDSWLRRLVELGHGDETSGQTESSWSTASAQPWADPGLEDRQQPGTWAWT